jgi:hypothetical protein
MRRIERTGILNWRWPDAEFDVIAAIFFQFANAGKRTRIFAGMCRTSKPGGLLLMQGYCTEQIDYRTGGPSQAENLYTRGLLEDAL